MPSYYECYYDHEDDRELWCGMLASHTPQFCEEVPFSRICDYFRKPVYRRSADV